MAAATVLNPTTEKGGIKQYYQAKIEECELVINDKSQDLRRLEAQRNALNTKGNMIIFSTTDNLYRLLTFPLLFFLCSSTFEGRTPTATGTWILCG